MFLVFFSLTWCSYELFNTNYNYNILINYKLILIVTSINWIFNNINILIAMSIANHLIRKSTNLQATWKYASLAYPIYIFPFLRVIILTINPIIQSKVKSSNGIFAIVNCTNLVNIIIDIISNIFCYLFANQFDQLHANRFDLVHTQLCVCHHLYIIQFELCWLY